MVNISMGFDSADPILIVPDLYGGGVNANSKYIAWARNYLDNNNIKWQTSTYKGQASGGTVGSDL